MPASTTSNGLGQENIFAGLKFWVSHQVPMRQKLLDDIKNNGGKVVLLEKQADHRIADHARKNVTPGSLSWKLITESVEHGCMQLTDRYCIGPHAEASRPAGSDAPARKLRTEYSREDDIALARWVLANSDGSLLGNSIYQDFEIKNPQHTWQSWRNRYKSKLLPMGWDAIVKLASTELPADDGAEASAASNTKASSAEAIDTAARDTAATSPRAADRQDDAEEDQFWSDFKDYVETCELEIEPSYTIARQKISLWQLYRAVEMNRTVGMQTGATSKADWSRVASELGYDAARDSSVPRLLEQCYEDNLAEFCDAMGASQEEEEDGDASDSEASEQEADDQVSNQEASDQEVASDEESDQDESESETSHSPPPEPAPTSNFKKRPAPTHEDTTTPRAKRQKQYSPDQEIPPTPDDKIGIERPQTTPSPSQGHILMRDSQQAPNGSARQHSAGDYTPSQQLRLETLQQTSPIPLRLTNAPRSGQAEAIVEMNEEESSPDEPPPSSPEEPSSSPDEPSSSPPKRRHPAPPSRKRNNTNSPPSATKPQTIDDWVAHYQSLGYAPDVIVQAFKHTTMTPGRLALVVMASITRGDGVPPHHEGIWTDDDDERLWLADHFDAAAAPPPTKMAQRAARGLSRLVNKHGRHRVDLRRRFLDAQSRIA